MVKLKKIFEGKNKDNTSDDLLKSVKELSGKIGEYPSSSTFITVEDAIASKSDIFLIDKGTEEESEIQRDFLSC